MADLEKLSPGQILADANVSEFIKAMGLSIAEAQKELDINSLAQVGEYVEQRPGLGGRSLLELGLSPPFYHYEHAELKVSMQLLMKVGNTSASGVQGKLDFGLGTGGNAPAQGRLAQVKLSRLPASLLVDEKKIDFTGADLEAAAEEAAVNLRTPLGVFDLVTVSSKPERVTASLDSQQASNPVLTSDAVVFFPTSARSSALLRIVSTPTVGQREEFVLAPDKTATVTAAANTLVFAQRVASALHAIDGFEARLISETGGSGTAPQAPGALAIALFDTGSASLKAAALREIEHLATVFAGEKSRPLTVFGYADTRGNTEYNRNLGKRRAEAVAAQLRTLGFSNVEVADAINHGEDRWTGTPDSTANAQFRRAEVRDRSNGSAHYILISSIGDEADFQAKPTPDGTAAGFTGNGFVMTSKNPGLPVNATVLKLGDPEVEIALSDAAVNETEANFAQGSAEAHAFNLAKAINTRSDEIKIRAFRRGSVVFLAGADDAVTLDLLLLGSKDVTLKAEEGAEIIKPLERIGAGPRAEIPDRNISLAVGATVDHRTSRMFETSVNGNSSISARLVAVPAPAEFLQEIRRFLSTATQDAALSGPGGSPS